MRIPDDIVECVVFVGRRLTKGSVEEKHLIGTAFIVGFPAEKSGLVYLYLVTARHVAVQLSLGESWFIRLNTKDGTFIDVTVPAGPNWWYHPDEPESVDAAACGLPELAEHVRSKHLPTGMFATDGVIAELRIGLGDEVFLVGLFTKMTGRQKNIPMFRMGSVAMMPTERVPGIQIAGNTYESEVYLVEARSVGGISGCPVFVRQTVNLPAVVGQGTKAAHTTQAPLAGRFFLLGLMHGHWDVREDEINEAQIKSVGKDRRGVNVGIAVVVPAKKILEILRSAELARGRTADELDRRIAEGTTAPDSWWSRWWSWVKSRIRRGSAQ